jgi:hypothetical protein
LGTKTTGLLLSECACFVGVWAFTLGNLMVQCAFGFPDLYYRFLLIKNMMGLLTGGLASLLVSIMVMQPELIQGGNLMEVYGLFFQVLITGSVFLFFSSFRNRWSFWQVCSPDWQF